MDYINSLSSYKKDSMVVRAVNELKKEGDSITETTPNGTRVTYVRGADFDGHTVGRKFTLYKEVARPDNVRFVTNANIIGNEIFTNEVFVIEPDSSDSDVEYVKYVYSMNPGWSSRAEKGPFNKLRRYPDELRKLLPYGPYTFPKKPVSLVSLYDSVDNNKPKKEVKKETPKLIGDFSFPENIEKLEMLDIPENLSQEEIINDVIVDECETSSKYICPEVSQKIVIKNESEPLFVDKADDDDWEVLID